MISIPEIVFNECWGKFILPQFVLLKKTEIELKFLSFLNPVPKFPDQIK